MREIGERDESCPYPSVVVQELLRRRKHRAARDGCAGHRLPVVAEHAVVGRSLDRGLEVLDRVLEHDVRPAHAIRIGGRRPREYGQQQPADKGPREGPGSECPNDGSHAGFTVPQLARRGQTGARPGFDWGQTRV